MIIIIFIETGLFFGYFFPGDSLLFTAGFLASQGYVSLPVLLFGTWIAAVVGDSVGYAIGKKVGPALFTKEMIESAGGDPITTGSTTDFAIPLETLIAADPELILLGDAAYGVTADQVKTRTGWKVMTAVKTDAIRPVNDLIVTRPGPRLVDGLRELAVAIHPDLVLPSTAPIPAVP